MTQIDPKKEEIEVDAKLVREALEDPEKFVHIVEKFEATLMRYLSYFVGADKAQAEDIFQEAMIKVYKNLNGFNQKMPFRSWLYSIVRHEALNFIKKNKSQPVVRLDAEDDEGLALLNVLADDKQDVPASASSKELSYKVREVLLKLREDYREILILRFLNDYNYDELSYVLKKPVGTVGVMISRAKESFKQLALEHNLNNYE